MTVSTDQPFQIVFSLFQHQYLGYLFNVYAVQLDAYRRLTLQYQTISTTNAKDFGLQEADNELIELIEMMQHEAIIKKYAHKKMLAEVFFLKVYDKDSGDKILQETIGLDLESKRAKVLEKLQQRNKLVFEMSNDGVPTHRKISIEPEKVKVLFHFFRNKDNTHYFPTLKHKGAKLEFKYKNAVLICNEPAYLLLEDHLYSFEKNMEGKKLQPFLHKNFIEIPKKIEDTYFRKFVAPLIENFDVHAEGFEIRNARLQPHTLVTFAELPKATKLSLLDAETASQNENNNQEEDKIVFSLCFQYDDFIFDSDNVTLSNVHVEKQENETKESPENQNNQVKYIFHKIIRNQKYEIDKLLLLQKMDLAFKNGKAILEKSKAFSWISQNIEQLKTEDIALKQSILDTKKYFVGISTINLEVKENKDWFDVYAIIRFGEYEIPFLQIRKMILQKIKEFALPNGEIAVIPDVWFMQYYDIFNFIDDRNNEHKLKKYHLGLLQDLQTGSYATLIMDRKLEKLRDFEQIDSYELPKGFLGDLRPYQKAGYDWLRFLADFNFGGCLADDMGLGKTVQTLAMLQAQKELNAAKEIKQASLLIMPTSLIYNWQKEAMKFAPELKVLNYTGANRNKNVQIFDNYDLILTSYGTARIDGEILEKYYFNYIILDESQAIKNPEASTTRALKELNSKFRLILTGTPIENTTMDLWSQMSFVNAGLLGNLSFFRNEFQIPIEKKNDIEKLKRLHTIIKPFILRRLKTQVAKDLPEKTINIKYCKMTEEQEKRYEEVKSHYRNKILEHIEKKGMAQSQMLLIQGLTQLRQIANHPKMVDENYEFDSGKLEDVLYMIETAVSEGHKILIFSQFVKHLAIVKEAVEKLKIRYAYLDGSTTNRQEQVELFQNDKKIPLFLISLKAGGVGLNLTSADYVFMLDPWWNPAAENQAIDRSHRIGQKQNVFVYKFIMQNTVEEKILLMQQNKIRLANDLISTEEGFMKSLGKSDIEALLQ